MTPRTASLRVAHQATCPNANQTTLDSLRGCKCKPGPSYYTFHRGRDSKPVKGARVRSRKVADAALNALQVEIDQGRVGQSKPSDLTFDQWATQYLEIIEANGRKASTVAAYQPTVRYCRPLFGSKLLREIGNPELRALVGEIRKHKGTDATVAKHLRHVGAILQAAVEDRLITENPMPRFKKSLRLQVVGGVPPYTDPELAKLWLAMTAQDVDPVYVAACKFMVTTGLRVGEVAALALDDLDLLAGLLHVRHHYDRASGQLTLPKDGEARVVNLTGPARSVLEAWIGEHVDRDRAGGDPLFVAPRGERLNGQYLAKLVKAAMVKAGIPDVGEGGRKRKPLHSLRATYTRIMLESGRNPQWTQAQLGHSSAELTIGVYGEWSDAAKTAEADRVEAETFPV